MVHLDETSAQIHQWLTGNFPLAKQREVGLQDSLLESGIIDSLGTLEVVEFLEAEFGIQVTDEEMMAEHFDSIESIARFVHSKHREHAGNAEAD